MASLDTRTMTAVLGRAPSLDADRLLESHPGAVLLATADGRIVYVNERLAQLAGTSADRLLDVPFDDLVHDPNGHDARIRRADGTEVAIDVALSWVDTPDGPLQFAVISDAAARRRTEAQAELVAQLAAALSEASTPDAVATVALEIARPAIGACDAALSLVDKGQLVLVTAVGLDRETVERFQRVPLSADLPGPTAVRDARTIAIARRDALDAAYPSLRDEPRTAIVRGVLDVPLLRGGTPLGLLVLHFDHDDGFEASDVTFAELLAGVCAQALERARLDALEHAARQAIEERDERLALALGSAQAGAWEIDLRTGELSWSDAIARMHGVAADVLPTGLAGYLAMIHREDRRRIATAFNAAVDERGTFDEEFRIVRPDGTVRWANGVARVFTDADGRPARIIGIARDVTDRRAAEAEREAFLAGEREANQLRDAFIGVVSHELRTPITTIYGGARVLARSNLRDEQRDEVLDGILAESERLRRLVEDLLVLSRAERRRLEVADDPVLVGHLVRRVMTEEAARWPDRTFEANVPANLPAGSGEETYVEQVVRNLLSNAAKYSAPGATITIRAGRSLDEVTVEVVDEGPGVHDEERERVFDLFYRSPATAARATGAGIGLFVTRRLIEAMRGRVWVTPNEGRGSTFGFSLPIHDEWRTLGEG
jgi:PAS domain S-box-containing protein